MVVIVAIFSAFVSRDAFDDSEDNRRKKDNIKIKKTYTENIELNNVRKYKYSTHKYSNDGTG